MLLKDIRRKCSVSLTEAPEVIDRATVRKAVGLIFDKVNRYVTDNEFIGILAKYMD